MTTPPEPPPDWPGYGPSGYPPAPPSGYPPAPPQGYPPYGYQALGPGYGPPGYGPPPGYAPPPGHLGWAIVALVCFWPLGIAAFINYARVDRDFYRGDVAGAVRASRLVRRLGIIAPLILAGLFVLWVGVAWIALSNTGCGGLDASC